LKPHLNAFQTALAKKRLRRSTSRSTAESDDT
jgi:hypothetical protein